MTILLTGGSACGKSTFAEKTVTGLPLPRYYIAAMRPYGEDGPKRIARHRKMRADKSFITIEKYTKVWETDIPSGATVLLECLCNLTANEMFDEDGSGEHAKESVLKGIRNLKERAGTLIIVTNDVGSDGNEYDPLTNNYVRLLGEINIEAAKLADTVIEMVCGIPIFIKGSL